MGAFSQIFWRHKLSKMREDPSFIVEIVAANVGIHRLRKITSFCLANKDDYNPDESSVM